MITRRQVAFFSSLAVAVIGAAIIWFGAAGIVWAVFGSDTPAGAAWLALGKAASLAWVGAVGWLVSWRRLDERQQETRKFSWFIGSTAAVLVTAPVMLYWLVGGGGFLAQVLGQRGTPGAFFALGWAGLLLAQLLGSLLARAGQWATKG
jgi:hypothetical protein